MRKWKGKRVDAERSVCITAGMADVFRLLALNNPFLCLDMEQFHALMEDLKQVIEKLQKRRREIKRRLRSIKQSQKAWNVVFTAVSIGIQVCSLVLVVAQVAPTVAVTAGAIAGAVIKVPLEQWVGSIWALKEKQVVKKMHAQLEVSLYDDLQNIDSLVQMIKRDYSELACAIHQHSEEETLQKKLENVMAKFKCGELKAAIISLENKVHDCNKNIRLAEYALRLINIPGE